MPRALWNDTVIAETDSFEVVEGNIYFPIDSIRSEYFEPSEMTTVCPWKGTASYFNVTVDGTVGEDVAWIYREPKDAAANIKDHVAFWHGVLVEK